MRSIATLFGKSPFHPIRTHMERVADCVQKVEEILAALNQEKFDQIEIIAKEISKLEHLADLTKNEIRNNLPKSLFLPIDRQNLLNILSIQDSLADVSEDIAVLLTLKQLMIPPDFKEELIQFAKKNFESFYVAKKIIYALHELFQTSFGGIEAETVKSMVDDVAYKEHEADLLQREILKKVFNIKNLSNVDFYLWMKVLEGFASISNYSEKLANCIRLVLETK